MTELLCGAGLFLLGYAAAWARQAWDHHSQFVSIFRTLKSARALGPAALERTLNQLAEVVEPKS